MDFSVGNQSAVDGYETVSCELPAAVLEESYNHLMSGYTCINVDETQFYFPNKLQVVLTLQWLTSNFEPADGISLPKCEMYKLYTEFCEKQQFSPVNAASFGKVIRQVYPELKTRRLGTRGQSQYHYYGIQVKTSSKYYKELSITQRQCPASSLLSSSPFNSPYNSPGSGAMPSFNVHNTPEGSLRNFASARASNIVEDKVGEFLLPEFPDAEQILLSDNNLIGKVDSFLEIYRIHCKKILEIVVNSKLDEVHLYIERFWRDLSGTSQQLLANENVATTIAVCDKLLYQTIIGMLMPGVVQHLIPSLLHAIRHFSCTFVKHLEAALHHQPHILVTKKLEVAQDFARLLTRKTSLSHLAQAMCTVLKTAGSVKQMLHDWRKRTEHTTVRSQLLWMVNSDEDGPSKQTINKYLCEFVCLLDKHITVEDHLKWLDSVRKRCLSQHGNASLPERNERRFMLQFCYLSNLIIRDQTLRSATSFGSFHLLHLLYEEYLLYVIDVNKIQQHEQNMWKQLYGPDIPGVSSLERHFAPTGYKIQSKPAPAHPSRGGMTQQTMPQAYPMTTQPNTGGAHKPTEFTNTTNPNLHDPSTLLMLQQQQLQQQQQQLQQPTANPQQQQQQGGFTSNSFAPIHYSPRLMMTPPPPSSPVVSSSSSLQLISSSPHMISSSPHMISSSPQMISSSPHMITSPRLTTHPQQQVPYGSILHPSNTPVPVLSSGDSSSIRSAMPQPLNLSNHTFMTKPLTGDTTHSSAINTKIIATQLLKVSLVSGGDEERRSPSSKNTVTLSVPLDQGLQLSKGQILKLSDGKSYNIDDVQTVLKEMNLSTPTSTSTTKSLSSNTVTAT